MLQRYFVDRVANLVHFHTQQRAGIVNYRPCRTRWQQQLYCLLVTPYILSILITAVNVQRLAVTCNKANSHKEITLSWTNQG